MSISEMLKVAGSRETQTKPRRGTKWGNAQVVMKQAKVGVWKKE